MLLFIWRHRPPGRVGKRCVIQQQQQQKPAKITVKRTHEHENGVIEIKTEMKKKNGYHMIMHVDRMNEHRVFAAVSEV